MRIGRMSAFYYSRKMKKNERHGKRQTEMDRRGCDAIRGKHPHAGHREDRMTMIEALTGTKTRWRCRGETRTNKRRGLVRMREDVGVLDAKVRSQRLRGCSIRVKVEFRWLRAKEEKILLGGKNGGIMADDP